MRAQTIWAAAVAVGLATGAAACGDDDGDDTGTHEAPPDAGGLVVTSTAFDAGDPIPTRYTCDGDDTSPPLALEGVPADAAELAIVVRDPDADGFVHWVVAAIPPETATIAEGAPPAGAVEAESGFGEPGWAGPCPPEGDHTYEFTVYALAEPSGLDAGAGAEEGAEAVESARAVATATLRGTYERG
ncbi:MAG TPA: YbhB/YbcL family Raf kinase inhibitor-like protein [Acidimicrobiales bacterium]